MGFKIVGQTAKPKKNYSVKEKVSHYNGVLQEADKAKKRAEKAQKAVNQASFAAGYNKAVDDCRMAVKETKKSDSEERQKTINALNKRY